VRKIRFKERFEFVVPIDISQNRVLLISNGTSNETLTAMSRCNNIGEQIKLEMMSIMKIPTFCQIQHKNFEIDMKLDNTDVSSRIDLENVPTIESRKIVNRVDKANLIKIVNITRSVNKEIIEKSLVETEKDLDKVQIDSGEMLNELQIIRVGGLSLSSITILVTLIVTFFLIKRRLRKRNARLQSSMNLSVNIHESRTNDVLESGNMPRNEGSDNRNAEQLADDDAKFENEKSKSNNMQFGKFLK
jgi:hypothetical protein